MSASLTRHTKFECLCEHEYRNPSLNKKRRNATRRHFRSVLENINIHDYI